MARIPSPHPAPPSKSAPPRMADVAQLAGVSKMTVSRVLAGHRASEEARLKVSQAVEALGYVADATATAFASGKSDFVAVLVPSLESANFSDSVRGLGATLEPQGLQLLIGESAYDPDREERLLRSMLRYQPRAVVLTGAHHSEETRLLLKRAGLPVVEMWEQPVKPLDMVVGFSNEEAAREMLRHLARRGYRNIGFIGGASDMDKRGAARLNGYLRELEAQGLGTPRVVRYGSSPATMTQGGPAMEALLAQWPDTDAVMCVSDMSAFGAIMECQRRGLRVPEDIAVAGFGNFEISAISRPAITTVSVDAYGIGARTAELLLAAMAADEDGFNAFPRRLSVEYAVVSRDSA